MGRPRKHNRHLPQRVYLKGGTYWFEPIDAKPVNLGRELGLAIAKYTTLVDEVWSSNTMNDIFDRYLIQIVPLKRSKVTQVNNTRAIGLLKKRFGDARPDQITAPMLYAYMDKRHTADNRPAPVAAKHEISLLGHVFRKAIRWGAADRNPVLGIEYAPKAGKRRQVTMAEVEAVKRLTNERMRVAIDLAVCTGQRKGDLLSLKRSQLTEEGIAFQQSKTGAGVLITWSDDLREIIARARAVSPQLPAEYVIKKRNGRAYDPSGFSSLWTRLMTKHVAAGAQWFTFHDLRSVSADGASTLEEARDRLGHSSSSTTQRFYRRAPRKALPRS